MPRPPRKPKPDPKTSPGRPIPPSKEEPQLSLHDLKRLLGAAEANEDDAWEVDDATFASDIEEIAPDEPAEAKLTEAEGREFLAVLLELEARGSEALALYEPMPEQERFHASDAPERVIRGGNRGGKAQPINEPVLTPNGWAAIGSLSPGDFVIGGDGNPCQVLGVFPQGVKPVYKVTFDDGATTRCCDEHLWKVKLKKSERFGNGDWQVASLAEIRKHGGDTPKATRRAAIPVCIPNLDHDEDYLLLDPYLLGAMLGDGTFRPGGPSFSTADEEMIDLMRARLPAGCSISHSSDYDYSITGEKHGSNPLIKAAKFLDIWGKLAHEKFVPTNYLFNSQRVRLEVLRGLMDTDGSIGTPDAGATKQGQAVEFSTTSTQLAEDVAFLVRSLGGKCRTSWRITNYEYKGIRRAGRPSARLRISLRGINPFLLRRKADRFRARVELTPNRIFRTIEADGSAECVCIAVNSKDHTYVTRDCIVTHNTLAACVELARALTGQDPYGKYTPNDGRAIVVGKDLLHCSKVLFRKLFKPGAFQIIRDPDTGAWRAYRPGTTWDDEHCLEARPAPPLIPHRFYRENSISWENKREEVVKSIRLSTGWEMTFFSSLSAPPQGWDADVGYFDEEIEHPAWYTEVSARLMDRRQYDPVLKKVRNGKFWWSATPQAGTQHLFDLSARASDLRDEPNPAIQEFFVSLLTNIHITTEAKDEFIAKLSADEDAMRVRVYGEFALAGMRVYPEFLPKSVHGCRAFPIPHDWTRYAAIDPGRQVCAVLFCAIPPPNSEYAGRKILYDELYIKKCDALVFATRLKAKAADDVIREGIIDHRAGRMTEIGSGFTPEEQYSRALKSVGFAFEKTKQLFTWGSDDVHGGIEAVRRGLHIHDGRSEWLCFWEKLPNLLHEAERYVYKRVPKSNQPTDDVVKRDDHLMDCWRYIAMASMPYYKPKVRKKAEGYTNAYLKAKRKRERTRAGQDGSIKLG